MREAANEVVAMYSMRNGPQQTQSKGQRDKEGPETYAFYSGRGQ